MPDLRGGLWGTCPPPSHSYHTCKFDIDWISIQKCIIKIKQNQCKFWYHRRLLLLSQPPSPALRLLLLKKFGSKSLNYHWNISKNCIWDNMGVEGVHRITENHTFTENHRKPIKKSSLYGNYALLVFVFSRLCLYISIFSRMDRKK